MNYKWAKDYSLKLLNQYTMQGSIVSSSYNCQADYLNRIPDLLNDAQVQVATTVGKIRAVIPLSELVCEERGKWQIFTMPDDFWRLCSGGLVRYGEDLERCNLCHAIGAKQIAVPKSVSGDMSVEYYRLPKLLSDNPQDEDELDNTVPAQMALPYYVAAHLAMLDNAFAYQALLNEFESKLERLAEDPVFIVSSVEDVYDGGAY